jgi:hypothetical protein
MVKNVKRQICLLATIQLFLPVFFAAQNVKADAVGLRAGAAKVEITPAAEEFPYMAKGEHPFVGVHDAVYARALVLSDGSQTVAVVIVDVTTIPKPQELSRAVAETLKIPQSNLLLAATHTHNVPLVSYHGGEPDAQQAREMERLMQGTVQAAREAMAHLQPARVSFARGEAWVNINNGEEAGLKNGNDPHGPSDKSLDVLDVQAIDGAPIALLLDYATHAEVMFRSVTRDGGYEVSGDLPGAVAHILESQPSGFPVVLFASAAAGDQLPLFKSLQPADQIPAADEGVAGWALLNVQARRLANSTLNVIGKMPAGDTQVKISAAAKMVECPGQHLRPNHETGKVEVEEKPPVQIPLSVFRINNIILASVAGDVGSEIGMKFKAASPFSDSTLITMTSGSIGYILADSSYVHPGHGVMGSPLKPGCAEKAIVDGLLDLISH